MSTTRRPLGHGPIPLDDDQAARTARGRTAAERAAEEIPQQSVPRAESGSATARRNLGAGPGAR
ncbi:MULTISPECIES: YdaU family protein [unclassified Streptomyces]|uniref:YdaU family protein n=1 Tax=unclassified Streptomyces TaxID=2593676 RepID=UPI0013A689FA|nr:MULTISPECIES: YdaU family protein [unclassified Streptomyces]